MAHKAAYAAAIVSWPAPAEAAAMHAIHKEGNVGECDMQWTPISEVDAAPKPITGAAALRVIGWLAAWLLILACCFGLWWLIYVAAKALAIVIFHN